MSALEVEMIKGKGGNKQSHDAYGSLPSCVWIWGQMYNPEFVVSCLKKKKGENVFSQSGLHKG